ncbi:zinc finger protein 236 [Anopheles aquasalis]|uniref:zinc finger protein 236 n=1 Tax=Anopheles aquasalis TaxID=42839 RepID=UPI00215B4FBE|nr:zinc finger protein 236 [Anopheles aquasalis]
MLHEEDDGHELDDTHLCIKCGGTVVGIENYIKHRKVSCGASSQSKQPTVPTEQPTVVVVVAAAAGDDDGTTVADSSTDQPSTTVSGPSFGTQHQQHHKKVSSSYDYHNYELESHHHHHHHDDEQQEQQEQQHDGEQRPDTKTADYKNEVNYEYELGADLFFSSLELQSSSKKPATSGGLSAPGPSGTVGGSPSGAKGSRSRQRRPTTSLSEHQQQPAPQLPDDWLAATPRTESDKLMKAVSDISGNKKVELYPIFHHESPEQTDEESEEEDEYDDAPPRTHTGGKWKPENRPSVNLLQRSASHWRHHHHHHWPPDKSPRVDEERVEEQDQEFKSFSPPPDHTKGKWVPGSKITRLEYKPAHQPIRRHEDHHHYWCSVCNRRLASRFVYERHLKTRLHLKRAQEESELERAIRPYGNDLSKQLIKPMDQESEVTARPPMGDGEPPPPKKRKRKSYYTKCVVCKMRLPMHLLGKHLISRYHYRRRLNHPGPASVELVLRNMHRIVLQAPFQCQPCKFYANTEPHFMLHWNSTEHGECVAGPGKFWCSFCKFECEGNFQMTEHLLGANHREVIAVINRSVPIIIRKLTRIQCDGCGQQFRYNAELRRHQQHHCELANREVSEQVRALVQNTFVCRLCGAAFPDNIRLLQHGQKLHRLAHYYCSICECSFGSAQESMRHRRTSRHRILSARKRHKEVQLVVKVCGVCKAELPDLLALKQHMYDAHPDVNYSCPGCGECFILPQELGRHVRDKNCTFFNSSAPHMATASTTTTTTIDSASASATHQPHDDDDDCEDGAIGRPGGKVSATSHSSATRSHLPGPNSIISNDSIKVNMNDRKLGKDLPHLYAGSTAASYEHHATTADERPQGKVHDVTERYSTDEDNDEEEEEETHEKDEHLLDNRMRPPRAAPGPVRSTIGMKLDSSSLAPSSSSSLPASRFQHQPSTPSSTRTSNLDCDNTVRSASLASPPLPAAAGTEPSPPPSAEIFFAMANIASENNTVYVDEIVGTIGEDGSGVVCWQCKICPFRTSSQAEFLFHEILHSSKLDDKAKSCPSTATSTGTIKRRPRPCPKLTCPLCGKAFSKASLRCHLRQHTDERLFQCAHCPMAFTRKTSLKSHTDNIHGPVPPQPDPPMATDDDQQHHDHHQQQQQLHREPNAICTTCGKAFSNRHTMLQHSKVHHGQRSIKKFACQHEDCHFLASSAADARRHLLAHSDERNFACGENGCEYRGKSSAQLRRHALRHEDTGKKYKCDQCDFASRIPGHLKRHLLVHSGQKPFSCPHCDYSCNNIENLRKHVISTSKHVGKFLYECKLCAQESVQAAFGTNFQKKYKAHLEERHKLSSEEAAEAAKL